MVRLRHSVWSALRLLVVASGLLGARASIAEAGVPEEMVSGQELAVLKAVVSAVNRAIRMPAEDRELVTA